MKGNANRLYIDMCDVGGRYTTINIEYIQIFAQQKLSSKQTIIMLYIIMQYDSYKQRGVKVSYGDLAKILNCSKCWVRKEIDFLLRHDYLILKQKNRGRAKSQYVPNVQTLQTLLKKYLRKK